MVVGNHQCNAANCNQSKPQFQLELSLAQFSPSLLTFSHDSNVIKLFILFNKYRLCLPLFTLVYLFLPLFTFVQLTHLCTNFVLVFETPCTQ